MTGGAGFIGSNMVEALLKLGAEVIVYDNLSSGRYEFLKEFEKYKGFKFIEGDLLNLDKLSISMKRSNADAVVHLAANPDIRLGIKYTNLDLRQGTIATYNVLEAARKSDVRDILFSSSSVVYGRASIKPTPENYGPLLPISLYGAAKLASEGLITSFSNLFGMRYYIYRFANVVGKNGTHGVIIDFVNKLRRNKSMLEVLGDGRQRKSYVDVGDCVNAMLHVYEKSNEKENVYNIASDDRITVREIAEIVAGRVAKGATIVYTGTKEGWPGDVTDTFLSNKKLKSLGFRLKMNSKQAVQNALELYIKAQGTT
ncbi:MAG: NAD-dependent epimerase/dehydratase family protein [Candidatus Micrarchaeaceae archaeon]